MKSVTLTINNIEYSVRPFTQTTQKHPMISVHSPHTDRMLIIVTESLSISVLQQLLEPMEVDEAPEKPKPTTYNGMVIPPHPLA